uniref:Uncharacterized protein n=1 Tax=Anguilla anguilla TaxID=7936 RepID=A0A0E9VQ87_ANGAN
MRLYVTVCGFYIIVTGFFLEQYSVTLH